MKRGLLLILTFIITIMIGAFVLFNTDTNKPSLSATTKYTREELQNFIVSTAASYFYKNTYTDYEGVWTEDSQSNYSSVYDVSPEELSNSKYTTMHCANFAANSYIYSFGFDFSKYRLLLGTKEYTRYSVIDSNNNQSYVYARDSKTKFKNTYKYFNKVYSCKFYNRIAKDSIAKKDPILVLTYQNNKYDGPGVNTFIPGIDTNVDVTTIMSDSAYSSQKNVLLNTLKSNLQPGDLIINDHHTMIWVGDLFEKNGGVLHSSGSSFQLGETNATTNSDEPISNTELVSNKKNNSEFKPGYDSYSVRYSSYDFIENNQIKQNKDDINKVITILRPINVICEEWSKNSNGEDVCEKLNSNFAKIITNAKARSKLKYLRVAQYAYNEQDEKVLSTDTSSVNLGDILTYKIDIKNMSKFSLCSSGKPTEKADCNNNNLKWLNINKKVTYNNIVINTKIPEGTTFVSCTNGCFCYNSNNKVVACSKSNKNVYWKISELKPGIENKYSYNVVVNTNYEGSKIINNGTRIKYDGSVLTMGKLSTSVNSTINGELASKFKKIINNDIKNNVTCNNSLNYITSVYNNFISDNSIKKDNNTNLSKLITSKNIIDSYFKLIVKNNSHSYTRKTNDEIKSLNGNAKIVNQMIVPYFYGGKLYEKMYYKDRMEDEFYTIRPLASSKIIFNVGDIIITMKEKKSGTNNYSFDITNAITYYGGSYYMYCNKVGDKKVPFKHYKDESQKFKYSYAYLLNELYSSDLYVVLRPSKYYNFQLMDNFTIKSDFIKSCPEGYEYKNNNMCVKTINYYQGLTYDDYGLKDFPKLSRKEYKQVGWKIYVGKVSTPITGDTIYNYNYEIVPEWGKPISNENGIVVPNSIPKQNQVPDSFQNESQNQVSDTNQIDNQDSDKQVEENNQPIKNTVEIETNVESENSNEISTIEGIYYNAGNGWFNEEDEKVESIEIPKNEGYKFDGYYIEIEGEEKLAVDSDGNIVYYPELLGEDTVLYAKWTPAKDDNKTYKSIISIVCLVIIIISIVILIKLIKKKVKK